MTSIALRLALAIVLAITALGFDRALPVRAVDATVERYGGADRYATAALVSGAHFSPGVPAVYIATGGDFPDALAGGPPAAVAGAPILLVTRDAIPPATAQELSRLAPGRIVVLGGPGAISDAVAGQLDAYDTGGGVTRLGGRDRYHTAALISEAHFAIGTDTAYVATGKLFPDALVGGVVAARSGSPVLLTHPLSLSPETEAELRRLAPRRIVVLGGPGAVSDAVAAALVPLTTSGEVSRLAGPDRYATGVAASSTIPAPVGALFVATGRTFPDALVAVPAAARSNGALLLVPGGTTTEAIRAEAARLAPGRLVLLGGYAVVTDRVTWDLRLSIGDMAPLPACAYQDVLTPFRAYDDWQRTLVDTIYRLPADYYPGDLVDTSAAGVNGGYAVRNHVIADLAALGSAARSAGRPIQLVSGFRSYQTQQQTFDYWVSVGGYEQALRTSARAGHSEHQLGTTVDVTSAGGAAPWNYADWAATPAGAWMAANAWRYGFVMSYPRGRFATVCYDYEPWHYRYIGRDAAYRIAVSGLTLREWLWLQGNGG